jgi:dienelactone hydrolase
VAAACGDDDDDSSAAATTAGTSATTVPNTAPATTASTAATTSASPSTAAAPTTAAATTTTAAAVPQLGQTTLALEDTSRPTTAVDGVIGASATRKLPTLVSYPAAKAGTDVPVAGGRHPLLVFSHGITADFHEFDVMYPALAAAGFIVAAPTFPYTSEFTSHFRRADIVHQPDDARYVLSRVLRLNNTAGDPLRHRIDARHIAAVGHSAGGYTTTGLFTAGHDPRLRAGVVMAGWAAPGTFAGPPARMLFLQGTADPVVPRTVSWAAWNRVPWPKAYVLLRRNSHSTYMQPGDLGYPTMHSLVTDFLRWTLTGDEAAHRRLPRMVSGKLTGDTQLAHR